MTHHPSSNDSYIEIECVSPNGKSKSYVRKYIRRDKIGTKVKRPKRTRLTDDSELKVKQYLKQKHKKR